MQGLIGARFLKKFLKGIRPNSKMASANDGEPATESGIEMPHKSDCLEKEAFQGKEESENFEKTAENSNRSHPPGA